MKKATLTIGLFSLMMVLTSFTAPSGTPTIKSVTTIEVPLNSTLAIGGTQSAPRSSQYVRY